MDHCLRSDCNYGRCSIFIIIKEPIRGLQIFIITSIAGIISGYIIDFIHDKKYLLENNKLSVEFEKIKTTFVSKFNIFWLTVFVPGLSLGY